MLVVHEFATARGHVILYIFGDRSPTTAEEKDRQARWDAPGRKNQGGIRSIVFMPDHPKPKATFLVRGK